MARQRQLLNARLGLDVAVKIGIDMSEIFSTEDLTSSLDMDMSRHDQVRVSVCKNVSMWLLSWPLLTGVLLLVLDHAGFYLNSLN
jgi:hypothetical protein